MGRSIDTLRARDIDYGVVSVLCYAFARLGVVSCNSAYFKAFEVVDGASTMVGVWIDSMRSRHERRSTCHDLFDHSCDPFRSTALLQKLSDLTCRIALYVVRGLVYNSLSSRNNAEGVPVCKRDIAHVIEISIT